MTDFRTPADLRAEVDELSVDDLLDPVDGLLRDRDEVFLQLMVDYGYRLGRGNEAIRARRKELDVPPGFLLPPEQ